MTTPGTHDHGRPLRAIRAALAAVMLIETAANLLLVATGAPIAMTRLLLAILVVQAVIQLALYHAARSRDRKAGE